MTKSYFTELYATTVTALRMAQKSVFIAVAWINFKEYYDIFEELLENRVHVEIIINDDKNNARYNQQIDRLNYLGAIVIRVNVTGTMHHKFCVIDNKKCLFGSYNWTTNAELRNVEDLNICDEPQVIYSYLKEFVALRDLSGKDLRRLRNPIICEYCGKPKMNILIVEQEGNDQIKIQPVEFCDCRRQAYDTEYYDISVYNNYLGIIEKYDEYINNCDDMSERESYCARLDFETAIYWSNVRRCRFGFSIVHAIAVPGIEIYGRHNDEPVYRMIWRERGMEKYIPERISRIG